MNTIVIYLVSRILNILEFLLFARSIMSWFAQSGGSKIYEFLCLVTEPIILPFRNLLSRVDALRASPLDFSPMLAFLVLIMLEQVLYML